MGERDNFIMIYNDFMADIDTYSHREQFIYFLLKGIANNVNESSVIDIEQIASVMGLSSHSKNRKAIQEILISMESKKLLLLYEDMMLTKQVSVSEIKLTKTYYAKLEDVRSNNRGFTKIYYSDVFKFLSVEEKSKDLMFAIYFNIVHRIYDSETSSDYSWVTVDRIEEETGINRKTIMSKIAIMMEKELLYHVKVSEGAEKDKNYYCRWSDRHMLDEVMSSSKDD